MRIKEAAERCRLTEKAIRLYEEKGLITPTVTVINGRRFRDYDGETLRTLEIIAELRRAFFSIEQITVMQNDPENIPTVFSLYRQELHTQYKQLDTLIARADSVEPEKLTSLDSLSAAMNGGLLDSAASDETDGGASDAEYVRKREHYLHIVWDEDVHADERERAYRKYLRAHTRWEFFYALSLSAARLWKHVWKPVVFGAVPLALAAVVVCTQPRVTEIDLTYEGYEIHYAVGEDGRRPEPYSAPVYSAPITLNLNGKLYEYLFRQDYYEGEINIDGFAPYTTAFDRSYTLEEELLYFNQFVFDTGGVRWYSVLGNVRLSHLKRVNGEDIISGVIAEKGLESLVFKLSELVERTEESTAYSSTMISNYLVFPARSAEVASVHFWREVWEAWQTE